MKNNYGLRRIFLPSDIVCLIAAALCTWLTGLRGWVLVPVLIGSWLGWSLSILIVFLLVLLIISLFLPKRQDPELRYHPLSRQIVLWVIGFLCRLAFLRLKFEGEEDLPDGNFLLVQNHRSNYDPIVMLWLLRHRRMSFITKPGNMALPLVGPWIYRTNFIPIDRENPREAMRAINGAAELISRDIVSVGVYPEGQRSFGCELLEFHSGVFKVAQKAQVPIVVTTIEGTEQIKHNMFRRPTTVTVKVLGVISAEEVAAHTSSALSRQVRAMMMEALSDKD